MKNLYQSFHFIFLVCVITPLNCWTMQPPIIIAPTVQFEHFDELRCAIICNFIQKPSPDGKQTLVISGYQQEDLANLQITMHGMFPQKKRSVCTLLFPKPYQQDSVLDIVAYLKDGTIVSFASTSEAASGLQTGDQIPENVTLKILPDCSIYGCIKATNIINLILKPRSIIKKLELESNEMNLITETASKIQELAAQAHGISLMAKAMVKIKELQTKAESLTTQAQGPFTEITIKGTVQHHSCELKDRVQYTCTELICIKQTNVNIQMYCLGDFYTAHPVTGIKDEDSTIRNYGQGKIEVAILPISPPDQ